MTVKQKLEEILNNIIKENAIKIRTSEFQYLSDVKPNEIKFELMNFFHKRLYELNINPHAFALDIEVVSNLDPSMPFKAFITSNDRLGEELLNSSVAVLMVMNKTLELSEDKQILVIGRMIGKTRLEEYVNRLYRTLGARYDIISHNTCDETRLLTASKEDHVTVVKHKMSCKSDWTDTDVFKKLLEKDSMKIRKGVSSLTKTLKIDFDVYTPNKSEVSLERLKNAFNRVFDIVSIDDGSIEVVVKISEDTILYI